MYYVYAYFEPGCEKPFYIGKGSGQRAYQHRCRCRVSKQRTHFYNKLRSLLQEGIEPQIVLLQEDITEPEAFELERWLIKFFKRCSEGGCLCNHTTGGEGGAGYKRRTPVTQRERHNRSMAQRGKKFTVQHRKNISKARQGLRRSQSAHQKQKKTWQDRVPSIKAYDPNTQEIQYLFTSTRDAERAGFDRRAIHHVLKGTCKTHKGLTWEYDK
jgi:hypothetical protein